MFVCVRVYVDVYNNLMQSFSIYIQKAPYIAFVCAYVCLSVSLSVSVQVSIFLSLCLYVSLLYDRVYVSLSVYTSVCLCMWLCLFVSLSPSVHLYLSVCDQIRTFWSPICPANMVGSQGGRLLSSGLNSIMLMNVIKMEGAQQPLVCTISDK